MKHIRQIASGVIAVLLLHTGVFALQTENILWTENKLTVYSAVTQYADVETNEQQWDALQVLASLGVMGGEPNGGFRPHDAITRAELSKMIIAMQNIPQMPYPSSSFSDVEDTHWAKNYIEAVKEMGIMEGNEDGTFAPERAASTAEISKVLVTLLGYAPSADVTGGYPDGYMRATERYLKAAQCIPDFGLKDELTRMDAAMLFYQALQTPLMENTTFGAPENAAYVIHDGSSGTELITLLNRSFGIGRE